MPRQPFPGTITAIAAQAKARKYLGERANVFIDGKFSFALDLTLIEKYQLARDTTIGQAELSRLLEEDGDAKAHARALHFLSYRPRSAAEVNERLKRDDWPGEVIERVITRLQAEGYLSDPVFAGLWVEQRTLGKPRGEKMLRQELRQKGVARDIIDVSLPLPEEELENAIVAGQQILRSKARAWQSLEKREKQDKWLQAMSRRGFSFPTARAAWTRIQDEDDAGLE